MAESYTLLSKTRLSSICLTCSTIRHVAFSREPTTQNFANLPFVFLKPPAYFLSLYFIVFYCFLQVADSNEVVNICVFKGILYAPQCVSCNSWKSCGSSVVLRRTSFVRSNTSQSCREDFDREI